MKPPLFQQSYLIYETAQELNRIEVDIESVGQRGGKY